MKICFLIADISGRGGTERATSMIANGLSDRQYKVDIITCRNEPESFFCLNKNIRIYSLEAEKISNKFVRKFTNFLKIWKLISDKKYDVVIAVDVYIFYYLLPVKIIKRSHCIAWEHFNYHIVNKKFSELARKLAVAFADQVVVLGKQDLNNYMQRHRSANNINFIYNPIAFEKSVNENIRNHRVIAAGRLTEQKGFDLLINAWKIIEKENEVSDWTLDIFGEGELDIQLNNQISEYGLERIYLKGYTKDLKKEYLNASIFVLSSRYEGFGLVLIEALACGLPCVSFDCPEGPGEIIENNMNGYLVENGNVMQLANKIMELMRDEEKRERFSANAHNNLQRFDLPEVLNNWEVLLTQYSGVKGNKVGEEPELL